MGPPCSLFESYWLRITNSMLEGLRGGVGWLSCDVETRRDCGVTWFCCSVLGTLCFLGAGAAARDSMATCRTSGTCLGLELLAEPLTDGRGREKCVEADSDVEVVDTWESLDGDRTDEAVVEKDGRWPLFVKSGLTRELLRGFIVGGEGVVELLACSGILRNGTCELRLVRNLLLDWLRPDSCDTEVFGLRCSGMLVMLSREVMLGTGSSSSESDERESTLVALGSKSAKLCSVFCVALDVRVCLLETLAA